MRWQTNKDQADYMRFRREQNRRRGLTPAERWAAARLAMLDLKFSPQVACGCRIFDFWCAVKGVAVEIDGPEHNAAMDSARDEYNRLRSEIIVSHVPNFDEAVMAATIEAIRILPSLSERRLLRPNKLRKQEAKAAGKLGHGDWLPPEGYDQKAGDA